MCRAYDAPSTCVEAPRHLNPVILRELETIRDLPASRRTARVCIPPTAEGWRKILIVVDMKQDSTKHFLTTKIAPLYHFDPFDKAQGRLTTPTSGKRAGFETRLDNFDFVLYFASFAVKNSSLWLRLYYVQDQRSLTARTI